LIDVKMLKELFSHCSSLAQRGQQGSRQKERENI